MKEIPGYPSYYAADDGCIYSCKSGSARKLVPRTRPKKPYLSVRLSESGKNKEALVHLLVLYAFKGPRPLNKEARHLDGNSLNNCPDNLKWGTRQENVDDKKKHGTIPSGELNGRTKLTKGQVMGILNLKGVLSTYKLSIRFGVGQTTISAIHSGRSWKSVL